MPGAGKALQTFAGDIGEGACTSMIQCGCTGLLKITCLVILTGMDYRDDVAKLADHIFDIYMTVAIFQNREGHVE